MKKILLFGDSNTWGHNPVDCSKLERPWSVIVKDLLADYDVTIDGECGRATLFGEGAKNGIAAYRGRYLAKKSDFDLIVIMLGTNDLLVHLMYEPEQTSFALKKYIDEARVVYGGAAPEFLIASPILINDNVLKHPVFSELYTMKSVENSKLLAKAIYKMTCEEKVQFINAADFAKASDIDGVHMEPCEHEKLAGAMAEKIREIV